MAEQDFEPLRLGPLTIDTPVVLAPMAGVTNAAFRQLCREQAALGNQRRTSVDRSTRADGLASGNGSRMRGDSSWLPGLYVCEMITSRGIVEGDPKTLSMLRFDPGEQIRSVQLYGTDPCYMAEATRILCGEYGVGHIDMNFGCPVPKVTRKGGGAALPWKRDVLSAILTAVVRAAEPYNVPATCKTRTGIDEDHLTYLDAGRIAEESGVVAIGLHGRTAQQAYSGAADWDAIAALVQAVSIPVLGNGDIWEAHDALAMVAQTGAAGVVVGRGCLGRPWLFRDLANAFAGHRGRALPTLGDVAGMVRRHAELLAGLMGERRGLVELRKHMAWYFKGFPIGGDIRQGLGMVSSFAELDAQLSQLDPVLPYPAEVLGRPRGRQGSPRRKVALPDGWLADTSGRDWELTGAELGISGG